MDVPGQGVEGGSAQWGQSKATFTVTAYRWQRLGKGVKMGISQWSFYDQIPWSNLFNEMFNEEDLDGDQDNSMAWRSPSPFRLKLSWYWKVAWVFTYDLRVVVNKTNFPGGGGGGVELLSSGKEKLLEEKRPPPSGRREPETISLIWMVWGRVEKIGPGRQDR